MTEYGMTVRLSYQYLPEDETEGRIHTLRLYEGPPGNQRFEVPPSQAVFPPVVKLQFYDDRGNALTPTSPAPASLS